MGWHRAVSWIAAAGLLAIAPHVALACTCSPRIGCDDRWYAPESSAVVFEATVARIDELEGVPAPVGAMSATIGERGRLVHLRDLRDWSKRGEDIVTTGSGLGDCGYGFEVGTRYLIEAYRDATGRLTTSVCTATGPLAAASEQLAYLASLNDPSAGAAILGSTTLARSSGVLISHGDPPPGFHLSVSGPVQRSLATEVRGNFVFDGLPPGVYELEVAPEDGYRIVSPSPAQVELGTDRSCKQLKLELVGSGGLRGSVIDATRRRVVGARVVLGPAKVRFMDEDQVSVETDAQGQFAFPDLVAGRYIVGVNLIGAPDRKSPFAATYASGSEYS